MTSLPPDAPCQELVLDQPREAARRWRMALHAGFCFRIPGGLTVRELLVRDLGMDPDYVENRVRTVFLGGRPVDDIDSAHVGHGAQMTLSTMLPGVAGITMGRDNLIATYRTDITYHETAPGQGGGQAVIQVKLLNFLAPETGHLFLPRGIGLDGAGWARVAQAPGLWADTRAARLDGQPVDPAALTPPPDGMVRYVVMPCAPGCA